MKEHFSDALPSLMQLEEGLSCCSILSSMRDSPELWGPIFDPSNAIFHMSSDALIEEILPSFSMSQILKEKEVDAYKYFCDYVESLPEDGM
jgi:hypothetical protein